MEQERRDKPGTQLDIMATRKKGVDDFQFGSRLGEGSYSQVFKAVDKQSRKVYAIKILSKKHIVKEKKIKYVNIEKSTLNRLGHHAGIVTLYYTFQDENSLYFVIDMAEFGELLTLIRKYGSLSESCTKYYMVQLIDAVDFMHSKGVIHRDLKPENILVNGDMRLMITDFGAAKLLDSDDLQRKDPNELYSASSFVGTAEYVSPELLKDNKCGFASDVWALGCILYQFIVGLPPFKGKTEYLTFEKIVSLNYQWPQYYIPDLIKDVVYHLLQLDPCSRLTIRQLQQHPWFAHLQWENKSQIWGVPPPKMEPYNHMLEQFTQSSAQFSQLRIKKQPASAIKKQLLNNTINQIRNESTGMLYNDSPMKTALPKVSPTQTSPTRLRAQQPTAPPSVSPLQKRQQPTPVMAPLASNSRTNGAKPQVQMRSTPQHQTQPQPILQPKLQPQPQQTMLLQRNGNQPKVVSQAPNTSKAVPNNAPLIKVPQYIADKVEQQQQQHNNGTKKQAQQQASAAPKESHRPAARPSQSQTTPSQAPPNKLNGSSTVSPPNIPPPKLSDSLSSSKVISIPEQVLKVLQKSEHIIKLDFIHMSELTSTQCNIKNFENAGLDDLTIHKIVKNNQTTLHTNLRIYGLAITDYGHLILYQQGKLHTVVDLVIDLTDKLFAMYDYEFDEEDQSGYLILEMISKDRLIFLSPLVSKLKGCELVGEDMTWVEALMKTKRLLKDRSPNTSSTPSSSGSPAPASRSSTTSASKPRSPSVKTPGTPPLPQSQPQPEKTRRVASSSMNTGKPRPTPEAKMVQNKKFAGGAAAAAFRRMK